MVELHQEGSAPAACTAGSFQNTQDNDILSVLGLNSGYTVKYSPLPSGIYIPLDQKSQKVLKKWTKRITELKKALWRLHSLHLDIY